MTMPRSKVVVRLPKAWKARVQLGFDDAMPNRIIEHLLALPTYGAPIPDESRESSSSDERSPKRRKIYSPATTPVPIAKGQLSFSRRLVEKTTPNSTAIREDVGSHLEFGFDDGNLSITSRPNSHLGLLSTRISLKPQDMSPHVARIVEIAGRKPRQNGPGLLWTTISLKMEHKESTVSVSFEFQLFWNDTPSPFQHLRLKRERQATQLLIDTFYPKPAMTGETSVWSPMDFYEAAFVPSREDAVAHSIEVPYLDATLFPYQKRTLKWLLSREGMRWSQSRSAVETIPPDSVTSGVLPFRSVRDADGHEVFLSDVFHTVTCDVSNYRRADQMVQGGILAEEMGLGKTLEILALIILNPRDTLMPTSGDISHNDLVRSGATLIVTPESLREQWLSEISRHASGLRVKHYEGCKRVSSEQEEDHLVAELAGFDIVITTYSVLSAELHFTEEPPERSRRYERAYRRTKSPLVRISWWRLCLDEAQMIENGYSKAATVARVLPRVNAWGITGTPVKDDVRDLHGLLLFLRYAPYTSPHIWDAVLRNKPVFQQLFKSIALRHTKALVRNEISLPPQKRFVISMPFSAVEEQHYQSLYEEMADACGLDVNGKPAVEDWSPEDYEEDMRIWLNRLRQTTLHPEVGIYSRRILGQSKTRPMRTVDEVLDAMLEQSENAIRSEERAYLLSRLAQGQLHENSPRVREALTIWEDVRNETVKIVADARAKFKTYLREHQGEKGREQAVAADVEDDSDSDEEGEAGDLDNIGRVGEYRRRLRTALDLHHRATFFCANAYFQIRDNPEMTELESDEFKRLKKLEDDGYEEAKVIRREILRQVQRKTGRLMAKIERKATGQSFTEIPELTIKSEKGIESGRIVDNLDVLYGELNQQANALDEWREQVIQLLLRSLVDEDDQVETTGEELGDSAKIQDELMAHITALRAVIADRQEAILGQPNELVKHETETSIKLAKDGEGPAPEKLLALMEIRGKIKPKLANITMRGAVGDFRGLVSRLMRDATANSREYLERKIASDQLRATQSLLNEQNKAALSLESEIESFKRAMNARLEYYRQLQAVSDGVLPYEGPRTDQVVERLRRTEEEHRSKLSTAQSKHRYLLNLKEAGSKSNEPRMCVICQTPFVMGILTVCGHQFCKECMNIWFKAHRNCPVCKRKLKSSNLHEITIKPQDLQVHSDVSSRLSQDQSGSPSQSRTSGTKKTMIYSEFNSERLAEIENIELEGPSFTTKVDTLVRHLIWLRENDPGAKSIIFSQYKDFLYILRNAFTRFRIGYASIDDHNGISRFKNDPAIECFLLHARAHSSGLNLVNASHVLLCEPLLNTALELQAIARVDRIGQQHETTVWLYLVSGTIEESIYNLSVRRRMEHMGRNSKGKAKESTPELLDASFEAANTLELEQAALTRLMSKDKNAGELVEQGDLWECLFGHVANKAEAPERDTRLQEQAVKSYLAGEAAEARNQTTSR